MFVAVTDGWDMAGLTYPTSERAPMELREASTISSLIHKQAELCTDEQERGCWRDLRRKFLREGLEALTDVETLEVMLAIASPKPGRNCDLARTLVDRFGSFEGVMAADSRRLSQQSVDSNSMTPDVVRVLEAARVAAMKLMQGELAGRPVISSFESALRYCRSHSITQLGQQLRILFLSKGNRLIADELYNRCTDDHPSFYPRKVARRALDLDASAIIMLRALSGRGSAPSLADVEMTAEIVRALELFDITVHDHIIVGEDHQMSLRARGAI